MQTRGWHKRALAMAVVGLLLIPAMISRPAAATDGESHIGNSITINPLGFVGFGPDIEYERVLGSSMAFALRGKFGEFTLGDWSLTSVGGGFGLRFFPQEENPAPRGLWVGPTVDVFQLSGGFKGQPQTKSMFYDVYAQLGYKWLLGRSVAFVLSPYIKLGYESGTLDSGGENFKVSGMLFGLGLDIGIAF